MSEDQITSAESFFITGRSYVTGAHAIVKSPVRQRYANDFRFVFPCMSLMAHAIEVYLKAWLSVHGYNDRRSAALWSRSQASTKRLADYVARTSRCGRAAIQSSQAFKSRHHHLSNYVSLSTAKQIPLPTSTFFVFVRLDRSIADLHTRQDIVVNPAAAAKYKANVRF